MIRKSPPIDRTPFSGLTPDVVLDAAASLGFEGDGILFPLNSYENRVYQLGRGEGALVLKFYRPARWSDAQIIEEHSFATELAGADLPVAAPVAIRAKILGPDRGGARIDGSDREERGSRDRGARCVPSERHQRNHPAGCKRRRS